MPPSFSMADDSGGDRCSSPESDPSELSDDEEEYEYGYDEEKEEEIDGGEEEQIKIFKEKKNKELLERTIRPHEDQNGFLVAEGAASVATLVDSTTSKLQQLQKAFAELQNHRAIIHDLERSLKSCFHELEDQGKEYEAELRNAREILGKREAETVENECPSVERLENKRDAVMLAIDNVPRKDGKVSILSAEPTVATNYRQCVLAISNPPEKHGEVSLVSSSKPNAAINYSKPYFDKSKSLTKNRDVKAICYPQLVKLCKDMDAEGLHKFLSINHKKHTARSEDFLVSLKAAENPAQLVLNSLQFFYPTEPPSVGKRKDSNLWAFCIKLMECLSILLINADLESVADVITEAVKQQAREIAESWKLKLDVQDADASNGKSVKAHAFLQLMATFRIASDFDGEELSRLIPMISRCRNATELCRFLGLSEKIPGVIEVLVSSGRQINAVNWAVSFNLTEQFSPLTLLDSYLKDTRKTSPVKPGNPSCRTKQSNSNARELAAIKSVIKCIEEHKLEEHYPLDSLRNRLSWLEKPQACNRRVTEAVRSQPKRKRANGVGSVPPVKNIGASMTRTERTTGNKNWGRGKKKKRKTGPFSGRTVVA